jgi:hypothetical protein
MLEVTGGSEKPYSDLSDEAEEAHFDKMKQIKIRIPESCLSKNASY